MEFSNFTVVINGIHTTIQYPQSARSFSYKYKLHGHLCFKLSRTQDSHMLMLVIRAIIVIVGFSEPLSLADVFHMET